MSGDSGWSGIGRHPGPASREAARPEPANLADILERVLDKGIVIAGDIRVNLLDIELLTIKIRLVVASVDRAREMGIDWWEHDPSLSSGKRDVLKENRRLRRRIGELEAGQERRGPAAGREVESREFQRREVERQSERRPRRGADEEGGFQGEGSRFPASPDREPQSRGGPRPSRRARPEPSRRFRPEGPGAPDDQEPEGGETP